MSNKHCIHCKDTERLHINARKVLKNGKTALYYMCAKCTTERLRKYRANHRKKINEIGRESYQRHKKEAYARATVNYFLRLGRITKKPCHCGSKEVEAHHPNYDKPLLIKWLCRPHHAELETRLHARKTANVV